MKKLLAFVSVLVILAACAPPETNRQTVSNTNMTSESAMTEAEAIAKEKAVWDALKRKDYDAFANMLATDYLEVGDDNTYDKAGIVNYLKDLDFTEATFSDWKLVPIDKDASLLLYNVNIKGKFKGQDIPPGPYRASSAWVNRDGKWQAIFYQETLATTASASASPATSPASSPMATLSASPAAKVAETTAPADPVEREKMVWDALKRKDYDAFAAFLDDAQVEVEPHGVLDKAGTLKGVRTFDATKVELSDFKTVKFDDDATLVTYVVTIPGPKPEKSRASSLWVNRGGKWLALFHQGTPASESAASPSPSASPSMTMK